MTEQKLFLERVSLIYMAPCVIANNNVRFEAEFSSDVKEVMPYLNTVIKNATYNPEREIIFFTKGPRMITLRDRKLAVQRADDQTDAYKIIDFVKDLINDTYANRESITPSYEKKVRTSALEIFSYLPRTNCKLCGEPTCLAFAVKLLAGEVALSACVPLYSGEKFSARKKEMEELVETMGLNS